MSTLIEISRKLRSSETKQVLKAVEELRVRGYLMDGSLKNMAFLHSHLEGADLMEANLEGVDLQQAHMEFTDLTKANLTGAKLVRTTLQEANFSSTILRGADLFKANLKGARNLTHRQYMSAKRLIGAIMPDGSVYDGRYNLKGDIDFLAWAKVGRDDVDRIAELLGITVDAYLKGQQIGKSLSDRLESQVEKILVIDDDPDIIMAVRSILETVGYRVIEAHNGTMGLASIKSEQPNAIILDVMMDTPTEGIEVAKTLRHDGAYAAFKELPILMLTSVHSTTSLSQDSPIEEIPVDLYVDKPIDPEDLLAKIHWVLGKAKE